MYGADSDENEFTKLLTEGREGSVRTSREKEPNEEIISYEVAHCGGTYSVEHVASVCMLEAGCS